MKRNTLTTAVLAGLTGMAGMVSVSNAVNVNPDGLGQVLLYPYYTARGGNDTLISVVNTTADTKAVKVRFIEALNSREVLDFNLYMSPYDVWVAAVTGDAAGGAKMITADTSCTVPYFQGGTPGNVGEQPFLNFAYTGGNSDAGPSGIERTASGYIELIEMGTLVNVTGFSAAAAAKHVGGVPRSGGPFGAPCSTLVSAWANGPWGFGFGNPGDSEVATRESTGGMFGAGSIINVAEGTMFSYNATAIDRFYEPSGDYATSVANAHTDPGSVLPNLNSGFNESRVFINGIVDERSWPLPLLAVNATITHDEIFNEYVVEPGIGARTEWVMTFPTKRQHTDNLGFGFVTPGSNAAIPPFTRTWALFSGGGSLLSAGRACENFNLRVWDREESEPETGVIVSPPPPQQGFFLCREANVLRFTGEGGTPEVTEIMKEPLRDNANLTYTNFQLPSGFTSGWVNFDLTTNGAGQRLSLPSVDTGTGSVQYEGLPVIGFAVTTYTQGSAADGVLRNYGGTFSHRGSRSFVPATTAP
jgi:hypothetical protein